MSSKSPEKRKKIKNDEENASTAKKVKDFDAFNASKFKSMLKNVDTTFLALEEFSDAATGYPEFTDYDIVKDYITQSSDCSEIFHLLDGKTPKSSEITKIFRALECILIRTGDDLSNNFNKVGENVVNHLTRTSAKQIYLALNINNKPNQLKNGLKLLTAMAIQGDNSAVSVLTLFDENNQGCLIPLYKHKNITDSQDVRACVIHFIIAFLLTGSNIIIRQLLKKTALIQNIFYGISHDKLDLIEIILPIFLDKVIDNSGISKSLKVAIFNANILRELTQLYTWCGPQKWQKGKVQNNEREIQDTASIEEKTLVAELVHKVLLTLCCSFKHGIAYLDKTVGTGKLNHNITLKKMLLSLQQPYHHPQLKQLVIQVLQECPDLLQHYLPCYHHSLAPRLSQEWIKCMDFILEIYENQSTIPSKVTFETMAITKLVSMTTTFILPPEVLMKPLVSGLKNESIIVRHKIMEVYRLILSRTVSFVEYIQSLQTSTNQPINWQEFIDRFNEVILNVVPSINIVMNCWNITINPKSHDGKSTNETMSSAFPVISVIEHLVLLEQFLCLNQQLVPRVLLDHPALLTALLDGVAKATENVQKNADTDEQTSFLRLYLLKIFSDTDARLLPWKRESKDGCSLMHQLLGMLTRSSSLLRTTRQLICKLLKSTGLFEDEDEELLIWLKHIVPSNKQTSLELPILARILNLYISNPYHYLHKLTDIISTDLPSSGDIETASIGSSDSIINAILEIDIGDLDDEQIEGDFLLDNHVNRLPFSPLIIVAMEMIKAKQGNSEEIKTFVGGMLPDLFHIQVDPGSMRSFIYHYEELLKGDNSVEYIKTWKSSNHSTATNPVSTLMMSLPVGRESLKENFESRLMKEMVTIETDELVLITQQLLLYIGESIRHFTQNPKENETRIKLYFRILQRALAEIDNKMAPNETQAEEDDLFHLPVFGDQFAGKRNEKKIVLEFILRNSTLRNLFLYTVDSGLFGGCNETSRLISTFISPPLLQIIENSSNCLDTKELVILKCSYAEQILMKLQTLVGSFDNSIMVKCLKSLLPYLEVKYQKRFLSLVLNLSESVLVDKKTNKMTETGNLVVHLLSEILQTSQTLFRKITMEHTSKIFNCLAHTQDEYLIKLCSEILERNPGLSLACSKDLWRHLLENSCEEMEDIMLKLFNNNYVCRQMFEDWLIKADRGTASKWWTKVFNSIDVISKVYSSDLPITTSIQDSKDLEIIQQLVLKNKYGKKEMKKMWQSISNSVDDCILLQFDHYKLLQALYTQLVTMDTKYREKLVLLCMKMLINHIVQKSSDENMKFSLLEIILQHVKMCESEDFISKLHEIWSKFVKTCLKALYLEPKLLNILISCLPMIYKESCDQKLPIKSLYDMLTSHSKFLLVMFGESSVDIKDTVLSLLLNIAERSHDCHDSAHIRIFLGAYGATLSTSDQKILKLIYLYEKTTANIHKYKPFLFGQKALDYYSSTKYQTPSIFRETKMADLLECLDVSRLNRSALNFPIYRKLTPTEIKDVKELKSECDLYDPCFLFPVFNQLLEAGVSVNCKQFISSNCLSFIFAALSSYMTDVRQAAYLILKKFCVILEKSQFAESEELQYLFEVLSRSIETANMKLCTVITAFLSRLAKLFISPENHMYRKLTSFLMTRPTIEFDRIPGFYRFFNSSELDHHQERMWMLSLMADGIRTHEDYMIYSHLYCFKLLESYFNSSISDSQSQGLILKIINAACLDVETVISLHMKNNILIWLLGVIEQLKPGSIHTQMICEVIFNIWFTIRNDLPTDINQSDLPLEFIHPIIQCLKSLLTKLSFDDVLSFNRLVKILSSSLEQMSIATRLYSIQVTMETLTLKDISLILMLNGKFNGDTRLSSQTQNILHALGVDIKSFSSSNISTTYRSEKKKMRDTENEIASVVDSANVLSSKRGTNDLDPNNPKMKGDKAESLLDVINIFLYWTPISNDRTHDLTSEGFLLAVSSCLDYCSKVKDTQLIMKVIQWFKSVIVTDTQVANKCQGVLSTDIEISSKVIGHCLNLYSHCKDNNTIRTTDKEKRLNDIGEDHHGQLLNDLNQILLSVIKHTLTGSECKKDNVAMWESSLNDVVKSSEEESFDEQIAAVFVQEFFMEAKKPNRLKKLSEDDKSSHQMSLNTDTTDNVMAMNNTSEDETITTPKSKKSKTPKSSRKKGKKK